MSILQNTNVLRTWKTLKEIWWYSFAPYKKRSFRVAYNQWKAHWNECFEVYQYYEDMEDIKRNKKKKCFRVASTNGKLPGMSFLKYINIMRIWRILKEIGKEEFQRSFNQWKTHWNECFEIHQYYKDMDDIKRNRKRGVSEVLQPMENSLEWMFWSISILWGYGGH